MFDTMRDRMSEVISELIASNPDTAPARIAAIGIPHRVLERYGPPERHDQDLGLTAAGIRARIRRFLNYEES